jgi:hypothetical protein
MQGAMVDQSTVSSQVVADHAVANQSQTADGAMIVSMLLALVLTAFVLALLFPLLSGWDSRIKVFVLSVAGTFSWFLGMIIIFLLTGMFSALVGMLRYKKRND